MIEINSFTQYQISFAIVPTWELMPIAVAKGWLDKDAKIYNHI